MYDICEKNFNEGVLCGRTAGWITHNGFQTMTKMATKAGSTTLGGPSYIHISKANASTIYYGSGSKLFWSTDAGETWTAPTSLTSLDGKTVTSFGGTIEWITTSPKTEGAVYLVTSSGTTPVWTSTDAGVHWTQPQQSLPNWQYRTIAADFKGHIYVGGDGGVLAFDPSDNEWVTLGNGIPAGTIISNLQVRGTGKGTAGTTGWLIATTYGRGMYYIKTEDIFKTSGVAQNDAAAAPANIESVYPNPVATNGASTIKYSLESGSIMQIAVYDNLGRQEKLLANEWAPKGEYKKSLDLSGLPAGTHYVLLTADGVSISEPVTIQ
jgi:hypothetical protein